MGAARSPQRLEYFSYKKSFMHRIQTSILFHISPYVCTENTVQNNLHRLLISPTLIPLLQLSRVLLVDEKNKCLVSVSPYLWHVTPVGSFCASPYFFSTSESSDVLLISKVTNFSIVFISASSRTSSSWPPFVLRFYASGWLKLGQNEEAKR